jgi:enoyl-[acyl-carrier-protein] reductase (NADH)
VSAAEVAAAIAYLASPIVSSTTGIVLTVDGGMHGLRLQQPASLSFVSWDTAPG